MDYTFGFDKSLVDMYGAKVAVFDAINGHFGDSDGIGLHPYVRVPADRDAKDAAREALSMHKGRYFVVRSGSRYEMLPGTSGMNDSERFVPPTGLMEAVESVRKPGYKYGRFVKRNGLQAEESFPVCIQPMVAESTGFVSKHPNRDLIMADYLKGDDEKGTYSEERSFWSDAQFEDVIAATDKAFWNHNKAGCQKPYAYFEHGKKKPVRADFGDDKYLLNEAMLNWASGIFSELSEFAEGFAPGYAWIMEYGPNPKTGRPVVYQLKPFKKIEKVEKKLKESNTDMAFGACTNMKLPVVPFYHPILDHGKFERSPYADDNELYGLMTNLKFVLNSTLFNPKESQSHIKGLMERYSVQASEKINELYGSDICLYYSNYMNGSEADFGALKPAAVAVSDSFRAGMQHNRTNLIQEVPVVLFGASGFESGDTIVINSDGVNATVRKV
jgi:hypothetical protein